MLLPRASWGVEKCMRTERAAVPFRTGSLQSCASASACSREHLVGFLLGDWDQDRNLPYAPPTRLHFNGASGFHFRPFVYAVVSESDGYSEDRTREYPVRFFMRGRSYSLLGFFKSNLHLIGVDDPGRIMLVGSDAFRRDEFSRLLFGGPSHRRARRNLRTARQRAGRQAGK